MKSKNQWVWITIFGGLVAFLALRAPAPDDNVVSSASRSQTSRQAHSVAAQDSLPKIQARAFGDVKPEDLFKSKSWFVPPPPPPKPPPPPPPAPPPPPSAPPLPYVFLGSYQEPGGKLSIYLTRLGKIYLVSSGDTLENLYHIDDIQDGYLGMTYLPLNIKQTLRIGVN